MHARVFRVKSPSKGKKEGEIVNLPLPPVGGGGGGGWAEGGKASRICSLFQRKKIVDELLSIRPSFSLPDQKKRGTCFALSTRRGRATRVTIRKGGRKRKKGKKGTIGRPHTVVLGGEDGQEKLTCSAYCLRFGGEKKNSRGNPTSLPKDTGTLREHQLEKERKKHVCRFHQREEKEEGGNTTAENLAGRGSARSHRRLERSGDIAPGRNFGPDC